jgi:pseudaminic acid synthase
MKVDYLKNLGKTFIIAEVSANHGQSFSRAVEMMKIAKKCGANAVKFQCYTPDTMTLDCNNKYFRIKHPQLGGQSLYNLYKKAYTPWVWFKKLKKITDDLGIIFFATSFDRTSVDFLESLNVPIHKVSSFELVDLPLIEYIAMTKKPLILSTGMANLEEIKEAVNVAKKKGAKEIALLKCVSDYPAKYEEMNLKTIPDMAKKFKLSVGLSDHSLGIAMSIAGVSLGARVIEKHFTLSRKIKSPDSFFSTEPQELKIIVENIRLVEKALGKVFYGTTIQEKKSKIFRRSLFVVKNMKKNDVINEDNIRSIRPGNGLHARFLKTISGKKISKNVRIGTPMRLSLVSRDTQK